MFKLNKKKANLILIIIIIMLEIVFISSVSYASEGYDIDVGDYIPGEVSGVQTGGAFLTKAGGVLGYLRWIGRVIAVVVVAFIGVKYMLSSIEEKAEYKKTAMIYVIGVIILFFGTGIVNIFSNLFQKTSYTVPYEFENFSFEYCDKCKYYRFDVDSEQKLDRAIANYINAGGTFKECCIDWNKNKRQELRTIGRCKECGYKTEMLEEYCSVIRNNPNDFNKEFIEELISEINNSQYSGTLFEGKECLCDSCAAALRNALP